MSLDEVEARSFLAFLRHRDGFVPYGSTVSITESEFDHATKLRRPTFCFLVVRNTRGMKRDHVVRVGTADAQKQE